jgi:triosephosphate isomerase
MTKKKLVVGNWKMHMNVSQASLLIHRLHERIRIHRDIEVVLAPTALQLQPISIQIDRRKFRLAAQNAYFKDEGAYTGEVSFTMLSDLVHYVIVGHSDRRNKFGESLDDVRDKVSASIRNNITPILCIGESNDEKLAGETKQVIHDQLTSAISNLTAQEVSSIVVAYEPVWAISSGHDFANHEIATPSIANDVAQFIRMQIRELYGPKAAKRVRILYGGSTTASNARGFLDESDIDGLLVGGASLNYVEFTGIVEAAYRSLHGIGLDARI